MKRVIRNNCLKYFSISGIIFWSSVVSIWFWDFLSMFTASGSTFIVIFLSLKYYFIQITEEINKCLLNGNHKRLIQTFEKHIIVEKQTKSVNEEFNYYLYQIVKLGKPCLNIFIYLTHSPSSTPIMKFFALILSCLIVFILFSVSYLCSCVTTSAHNSQNILYNNLMNRYNSKLPILIKLKIMRFIERLSGPKIGFYCYNLFPMTSYYFTDYVLDSIASYFLILGFLRRLIT